METGIMISIMLILLGITFVIISFKSITSKWVVYTGAVLFIIALALFIVTFKELLLT